jgi:DNA repair exonuclease SbcCD nuclease subunit
MRELYGHSVYDISYFDKATVREYDGTEILLLPWICSSNYDESMKIVRETSAQICFGHLEIQGFMMYRDGLACQNGLTPEVFSRFDVVCSGHFHHRSTMENINYLGSPYEMTWSDYNDSRGFHVFDTEKRTLTFVRNPYKLFHKIVYDDSKMSLKDVMSKDYSVYTDSYVKVIISSKNNPYVLDKLLDNLYQSNPHNVAIVDDHKNINEQSEEEIGVDAEDTLTVLRKYVSNIDISDNEKYLVKAEIDNLYHQAQNMEI